jgi:RNase P subunit RPR2
VLEFVVKNEEEEYVKKLAEEKLHDKINIQQGSCPKGGEHNYRMIDTGESRLPIKCLKCGHIRGYENRPHT